MNEKYYKATVIINGKNSEDFIIKGKSPSIVKKDIISFFKKTLDECSEIDVKVVRVERIDGDYFIRH